MRALTVRQRLALQAVQGGFVTDYTAPSVPSLIRRGLIIARWRYGQPKTFSLTAAGREALGS